MKRWIAISAIILGLTGGSVSAQTASDTNAPVDISADEQEVVTSQCRTVFRGAVEVLQDKARMRSAVLTVHYKRKAAAGGSGSGCGDVDRVEAEGDVFYVTPQQVVRGNRAVYDYGSDTIVITGDVVAVQGQDVARGDRMTIKVRTNDVRMESNTKGRGKPNRVRAVVYPDETRTPAGGRQ